MKKIIGIFIALSAILLISYNVYSMQKRIKKFEQTKQKYIELYYDIAKTVYPVAKKVVKTSKLDDNTFHVVNGVLSDTTILIHLSNELEHYAFPNHNFPNYKIPNSKKVEARFLYNSDRPLTKILYDSLSKNLWYNGKYADEILKSLKKSFKKYVDVTDELIKRYNLDEIKTD